jgi:hypothetical protein
VNTRINILQWILTKLGTFLVLKRIWNPIDFQGQRSRSPGQMFYRITSLLYFDTRGRHDRMVVGFPTIYAIGAYVVILWLLDFQLSMQSVPITTKVVSSNPVHGEVYSIQHYVISL